MQMDARHMLSLKNAHRLLITGVLLAAKLMDDSIYNNCYWAKASLIPVALHCSSAPCRTGSACLP